MLTTDQARQPLNGGGNVVDPDDKKIGSVGRIFLDDQTGTPEWVRAGKEAVTDEEQVDQEVRKEQMELDGSGTSEEGRRG